LVVAFVSGAKLLIYQAAPRRTVAATHAAQLLSWSLSRTLTVGFSDQASGRGALCLKGEG
jgi:hypothetical protein